MSFFYIKQYSLKKLIIHSILLIILSQLISSLIMVRFISKSEKFDKQIFNILKEQVDSKSDNIKTIMYNVSKNVDEKAEEFNKIIEKELLNNNTNASKIYLDDKLFNFVEETSLISLKNIINKNNITGAFVILNGSNKDKCEKTNSTTYLRANKSFYNIDNNSKVSMKMGNKILAEKLDISTKNFWKTDYDFKIEEECSDKSFYTIPTEMLKLVGNKFIDNNLGYWSSIFENFYDKIQMITYTVPLVDFNNNVYGVYGIEISLDYIGEIIESFSDLPYKKSFITGCLLENDKLIVKKPFLKNIISETYLFNLDKIMLNHNNKSKYIKTVSLHCEDKNNIFYISFSDINLNKIKKAYDNENFKLALFANKIDITLYSDIVKSLFIIPLIFSSIVAFFISLFFLYSITSKLKELSSYILNFKDSRNLTYYKTNLKEINEIINAVNILNKIILDYDKHISKILDTTKVPIGCFEDRKDTDTVFVTPRLFDILGINKNLYDESYIPKEDWNKIFFKILEGSVKGKRNIYRWKDDKDSIVVKWLRCESEVSDDKNVGVIIDVTEDMRNQAQLEFELDYDIMTNLLNRNAFKRKVGDIILCNPDKIGALIFADLDNLKYINDTYGHDIGDKYIITAAEMFSYFKVIEAIVARISGDEFAIFIYGFDNLETARKKVYDIISKNNNFIDLPDKKRIEIKFSLGISWYGIDSEDISLLMKYADFAMYQCKEKNKGNVIEFNKNLYEKNIFADEKKELLCKIINNNLIRYVFQPIVSTKTGEIWGYEALMRCKIKDFKTPLEILSKAELYSKLYDIEKLTMFNLIKWINDNKTFLKAKKICINTIVTQILKDKDFNIIINKLVEFSNNIVYELTDNDIVSEIQLIKKLNILRNKAKGIVSIDASISGKISELEVLTVNPDIIKIPRKVISNIYIDKEKQKLISNLISYYKNNNIKTIALGVETKEELKTLISLGIDMVQGNYIFKPTNNILNKDIQNNIKMKILHYK